MSTETLSVAETARRIGKSERWTIECLRRGDMAGLKVGRDWRVTEADIAEYFERCRRPAIPQPKTSMTRTTQRRQSRRQP